MPSSFHNNRAADSSAPPGLTPEPNVRHGRARGADDVDAAHGRVGLVDRRDATPLPRWHMPPMRIGERGGGRWCWSA